MGLGYQRIASLIALPTFLIIGLNPHKSGNLFTLASFISSLTIGLFVDLPLHSFPPTLVFLNLIGIILSVRTWFFKKLFLYRMVKFELIAINICVVGFIISAILLSCNWQQWLLGGVPTISYMFFSMVIYKDRNEARLMVEKMEVRTGSMAPDFTLPDQNGNSVSLKDILSKIGRASCRERV